MAKLRINIILPFPVTKPVGGPKIMYEYANRLAALGHSITIYHAIERPFKKSSTPTFIKQAIFALRGVARPKWFTLDPSIKSVIVPAIINKHIADADICFGTWWQMAYAINGLPDSKGKKFNLIQDYEIWGQQQDKVDASFSLPLHHLVIARYLQELVTEKTNGKIPEHIPNAIDTNRFTISNPIRERKHGSIIMMYSEEPRKGTGFGITALKKVHEQFPGLDVQLFGVYPEPSGLPAWMHYVQRPDNLPALYNRASIFISPSLGEGWALPPAEAMACGCAVVCTNIGGHRDYAIQDSSALLVDAEDADGLAEKIIYLINNDSERKSLAERGNRLITEEFSWNHSVQLLEKCFYSACEK